MFDISSDDGNFSLYSQKDDRTMQISKYELLDVIKDSLDLYSNETFLDFLDEEDLYELISKTHKIHVSLLKLERKLTSLENKNYHV